MGLHETTVARIVDGRVGETVIFAVARARNVAPTELERPLYDAIDSDALDLLFASAGRDLRLEFTWADCRIEVFGDGRVVAALAPDDDCGAHAVAGP